MLDAGGGRYFDDGESTEYEGAGGNYATQTLSYSLTKNPHRLEATVGAAVLSGGFALPAGHPGVVHTIELRGRHPPSRALANGAAMNCTTVGGDPAAAGGGRQLPGADLARPLGTTMCAAAQAVGLSEVLLAVFEW